MAFHIRKLAMKRGIVLTEAVRETVQDELARERGKVPPMVRLKPLFDEVNALPRTELKADKAFHDDL